METSSKKRPRETHYSDTSNSFAPTLLGYVYRMYASAPDFGTPGACLSWGASMLLLPDGSGSLVLSSRQYGDGVRHATIPLQLTGENHSAQKCIRIELARFKDRCVLHGKSETSSAKDACKMMNDFACDILEVDGVDWQLKLYPLLGGHSMVLDGEDETTLATDIVMTTPNCDELGHYLFRKTGPVSADMLDAAVINETIAWDALLRVPKLAVCDKVFIRVAFESANKEGSKLNPGMVGTVKEVDEDGDALVDFGSDSGEHWIFANNFNKLSKL